MSKRYGSGNSGILNFSTINLTAHRGLLIGAILFVALIAFEIFNFDTTQFALQSLLGNVQFLGLQWATILAIAFCSIDFAGLNRLFTPESASKDHREVWFLMGAWLLGATLNAVMTWWAVSVTLLDNNLGNEVLSRQQLLKYVPIFVAVLVWLTRILFIGSLTMAGVSILGNRHRSAKTSTPRGRQSSQTRTSSRQPASPSRIKAAPRRVINPVPKQTIPSQNSPNQPKGLNQQSRQSRVKQRPPMPNKNLGHNSRSIQA